MKFSCFLGGDTHKSWHRPNLKRNRFKFLHLGPTELSVPKLPLLTNPCFREEIGNSDDASSEMSSRQRSLPSLKSDRHPLPKLWASVFLVPKMEQCPKSTMPRPYPEFYLGLLQLWVIQSYPEYLGQIYQANLLWEPVKIWGPKFQRAQKRELGPKKKSNGWRAIFSGWNLPRKIFSTGLRPVWPNTGSIQSICFRLCNGNCPENRFCTITHCLLNEPFSNYT